MRWSWCLSLLACQACYRPSATLDDRLGDGAVVGDGTPSDGETPPDGPLVTCVDSAFQRATTLGLVGSFYSRNVSSMAMYVDNDGDLQQINAPGQANPVAFLTPPASTLVNPVLSVSTQSNKLQAFFVMDTQLVRSDYQTGVIWTAPVVLSTSGAVIDPAFALGQPTDTIPRRAFASRQGVVFEGVESGTSWAFTEVTIPGSMVVLQPSLSRDGLAVVFVGQDTGGFVRLFLAKRASVSQPFSPATPLLDQPTGAAGTEAYPRFGPDCDHIFLSLDSTVIDVF